MFASGLRASRGDGAASKMKGRKQKPLQPLIEMAPETETASESQISSQRAVSYNDL